MRIVFLMAHPISTLCIILRNTCGDLIHQLHERSNGGVEMIILLDIRRYLADGLVRLAEQCSRRSSQTDRSTALA